MAAAKRFTQTKMAAAKREVVPNQRVSRANNNRRALGDIGNIVVDAGVNVTKEGVNGRKPLAQVSRPITRSFGAQLIAQAAANKGIFAANNQTQAPVVIPKAEVVRANNQRRTRKSKDIPPTTAVPEDKSDDCVIIEQPHRIKPACNRNAGAAGNKEKPRLVTAKPRSLTASLTSRTAVALHDFGFDDEMPEAEEDPLPNIDGGDLDNQLAVVEYVEGIYKFYRRTEHMSCVPDYMPRQRDINGKMRAILINWLIEVHYRFGLMPETLYLTINLLDRYLSIQRVSRNNFQLVGTTAMLLASKYEEIWAPKVDEFLDILENNYERKHVLVMEKEMLNKLKFHLTVPTPYVFLVRFLKAAGSDEEMANLVFFLTELSLMQYVMIKFPPSMLAAAAVYTARCTLQKMPVWSHVLKAHSGYSETDLKECVKLMVAFHQSSEESKLNTVIKKYSTPEYNSVAFIKPAKLPA
uniref:Uncharacterized protein n=1 Tax=Picea sitchensis TaxID=3332 RepID=D5AC16_PICSI|nr:unknown [Picea sitchensis]